MREQGVNDQCLDVVYFVQNSERESRSRISGGGGMGTHDKVDCVIDVLDREISVGLGKDKVGGVIGVDGRDEQEEIQARWTSQIGMLMSSKQMTMGINKGVRYTRLECDDSTELVGTEVFQIMEKKEFKRAIGARADVYRKIGILGIQRWCLRL